MAGFPLTLNAKVTRVETRLDGDDVKNLVVFDCDDAANSIAVEMDDAEEFRAALVERLPIVLTLDVPKLEPQY